MAASFVKHIGSFATKTAGTTIVWAWPSSSAAGNLIVCYLVFDNFSTASKPVVSSISKMAGETANWVFLGATRSTSTSSGAFSSGEIWAIQTTVAWTTPTITATLDSSVTMRSMGFSEFTKTEAVLRSTAGQTYSTSTTAASASSTGTAPVIGDLAVGLIFQSNSATVPTGDNDTAGGSWSAVQGVGSTGSSGATNNMGAFQYKVVTTTAHQTLNNQATLTAGNGSIVAILRGIPNPKTETLTDDFATDNTTKWPLGNRYNSVVIQNGRVEATELTGPPRYSGILTPQTYSIMDSSVSVKLTPPTVQTASTETTLTVRDVTAANGIFFIVYWDPGQAPNQQQVCMRLTTATVTNNDWVTYNAATMAYVRVRQGSGNYYWDTSPDGRTWTTRRTLASAMVLDAVGVELSVGQWAASEPTQNTGYFDDVNLMAPPSGAPPTYVNSSGQWSILGGPE